MLKHLATQLVDFLFPKEESVYELEILTSGELLRTLPPAEDLGEDTLAIFNYADPRVRQIIWELKYRKNTLFAKRLATIASDILRHELAERALFNNFINPLLIPMPMSSVRRAERGYNQTEILAAEILALDTERLLEYAPDILHKDRHTPSQARTHSKRDRLENVEGSMKVHAADALRGRCVVILDDVTTTGASFREARRALREAGARKVLCLAIAH